MPIATGTFDVQLNPLEPHVVGQAGVQLNRLSIDKTFEGDLSAESHGEMLSAMSPVEGSAGYVAIEQVIGTLDGKQGSFVLQHYGMMTSAEQSLILEVVADSGTDDLAGLAGSMVIRIEDGKHFYDFDYTL